MATPSPRPLFEQPCNDRVTVWPETSVTGQTWDSLGVVSLAVGVDETFGYHFTPEEATGITNVPEIVRLLETKGINFDS